MRIYFIWIISMILPYVLVTSLPVHSQETHHAEQEDNFANMHQQLPNAQNIPKSEEKSIHDEKIISVRITSSVAVGRTKSKPAFNISGKNKEHDEHDEHDFQTTVSPTDMPQMFASTTVADITSTIQTTIFEDLETMTDIPPNLIGANIEFIKQLQAKKGIRGLSNYERLHPYHLEDDQPYSNQANDSVAESSVHSLIENDELIEDVPLARSVPLSYSSKNFIQHPPQDQRGNSRLTTVNFNVVHDVPKVSNYNNDQLPAYVHQNPNVEELNTFYNQPSKVYSQPAQVYSEPAKFYSEPAKIYSEPAKIYSEPSKIYSEPAKFYSEPAKFYSQPASLHLSPDTLSDQTNWGKQPATSTYSSTVVSTTSASSMTNPPYPPKTKRVMGQEPEKNYEVDEKVSVMTDGRTHGEQPAGQENCKQENCKVGYVVEGRQFRKYRVEERTPDGFIVGEYGVVRNEDGALRGVRYTADSDASPRLIHDALMKFLQL